MNFITLEYVLEFDVLVALEKFCEVHSRVVVKKKIPRSQVIYTRGIPFVQLFPK